MDIADPLAALSGWAPIGASGLLVLVVLAILRGLLVPKGLIPREDHLAAVDRITRQADARVQDALRRAETAEQREDRWRDAWIVSESGRRLALEQSADVVRAVAPVATALTSPEATRGLRLPHQDP